MNKIGKVLCMAIAGVLCVAMLAGCGKKNSEASATPSTLPTVEATATPVPTVVATPVPVESPSASVSPAVSAEPVASASASAEASTEVSGEVAESSASASAGTASSDVLKLKDESDAVTKAQERLEALGYLDKVTGYYGTDTETAVKKFQENNGLDVDGKIGPNTLKVLMSEDAKKA